MSGLEAIALGPFTMMANRKSCYRLSALHVEQMLRVMDEWPSHFGADRTYAYKTWGVPSLLARMDLTIDPEGQVRIYEIDDRPGGAGLAMNLDGDFAKRFAAIRTTWPAIKLVVSPQHGGLDDEPWLGQPISLEEALDSKTLVFVRSRPTEEPYYRLEPQSVSTIRREGDKGYGVNFEWWRQIDTIEEWMLAEPGVFKPRQGCGSRDLRIVDPQERPGSSSSRRVKKTFKQVRPMYYQPYYPPMASGDPQRPYRILRITFAWDVSASRWVCLGGVSCSGTGLVVHGQPDSVFGLVELSA